MAGTTVAELIDAMPLDDSLQLASSINRLFSLEDEIEDDFLGLACVQLGL